LSQAVAWRNLLVRLGLAVPLVVVHDVGLVLTQQRAAQPPQIHEPVGALPLWDLRYRRLLQALAASEAAATLSSAPARDETVAVVMARLFKDVFLRWSGLRPIEALPLPVSSAAYAELDLPPSSSTDLTSTVAFLQRFAENDRRLLVVLDQTDLEGFHLLDLFGGRLTGAMPDLADLFHLVGAPGLADVVRFSLELVPSLLETKRHGAVQHFSVDGYAALERRGQPDNLLPSELAYDRDVFAQKALLDELLYYGHERHQEGGRFLQLVLCDASASMRGRREVFARGLTLALCKKLSLLGADVWVRFFDSRLHERLELSAGARRILPRLLAFRSERGRNYARVFTDLAAELTRLRRDEGREIVVTFVTHAECHIPPALVKELAREARLYGVFVLPSRPMSLSYLPWLAGHQVVTAEESRASVAWPAVDVSSDTGLIRTRTLLGHSQKNPVRRSPRMTTSGLWLHRRNVVSAASPLIVRWWMPLIARSYRWAGTMAPAAPSGPVCCEGERRQARERPVIA